MEPSGQLEIRRLEIERELKLREFEARERELEAQKCKEELEDQQRKEELEGRQRKEELKAQKFEEELELKHEREMRALEPNPHRIAHKESIATKFDLGKNVRLVPPFNDIEVDKYFHYLERVAQNLK